MMEEPVAFNCGEDRLFGIVHKSPGKSRRGVLVVVGGPQYRAGSHRQFVLLARYLADNGIPVMRFDYRGMGDSEGARVPFERIDNDINAAIDAFTEQCPDIQEIVIWGLCDAASAALFYGHQDERVTGMVLLNPWVFTEQGSARTYLKHYYLQRILNKDLWRKIIHLEFDYRQSFFSLFKMLQEAGARVSQEDNEKNTQNEQQDNALSLPDRMRESLERFTHPVLLILSGNDLTADEFKELIKSDRRWQKLINHQRITRHDLNEADHTFSTAIWRDQVAAWTADWVKE